MDIHIQPFEWCALQSPPGPILSHGSLWVAQWEHLGLEGYVFSMNEGEFQDFLHLCFSLRAAQK